MSLIVSNIIGGLGNQMFQYAAGLAISLRTRAQFKIDIRDFSGYKLHQGFELHKLFKCQAEIISDSELSNLLGWQKSGLAQRFLRKKQLEWLRSKNFIVEPHFDYWQGINQIPGDSYLYGYWQSEKYFSDFAEIVRQEFTFLPAFSTQNVEIAEQISLVNSISLHVRRGDYVTNSKNAFIGTCTLDYYQAAINYIKGHVENPIFFIFSDDADWAIKNLPLGPENVFIRHNKGTESFNDMHLMSLCQHNVIANSSFSWWGAWLNKNPEKIVISPKLWFAKMIARDLIPSKWLRI